MSKEQFGISAMDLFSLKEGSSPLIISIPHAGTHLPPEIAERMTNEGKAVPDTDWFIPELYADFTASHDVTVIAANYSRYVVDLNRPPDDTALYPGQAKVGLCPDQTFDGQDIYKDGEKPDAAEIAVRTEQYWKPYHEELARQIARVKAIHGYAIVYDAHSIRAEVPRLFDGRLPDLNLGSADGKSCDEAMAQDALKVAQNSDYSAVLNGRFIGGYITRHYGDPAGDVHALQMELAQDNYMDEDKRTYDSVKAARLQATLGNVLNAVQAWANAVYAPERTTPAQGLKPKR